MAKVTFTIEDEDESGTVNLASEPPYPWRADGTLTLAQALGIFARDCVAEQLTKQGKTINIKEGSESFG